MNDTLMLKEIMSEPIGIQNCYDYNQEKLKEIAHLIEQKKPKNIILTSRGTSYHSAMYAKYLFEVYYHIPVSIAAPSVFTVYDTTIDFKDSVVIAISQSGKGKDIHAVLKKANEGGALTIAITNELESIIGKEAQLVLYNNVGEAESYAATKTYTSTLFLLTKLVYELTHEEKLNLDQTKLVSALEKGLAYHNQIKEIVIPWKDVEHTFTLARGFNLTLALEIGLKIKETSHFHVSSYPLSEFYHGPIVMIHEHTPVILFAIDKGTNGNVKQMLQNLKTLKAHSLVFTNVKELADMADQSVYIEEKNDLYAMFTAVITLQLFACELSVLRGNNPDFIDILEHIETY